MHQQLRNGVTAARAVADEHRNGADRPLGGYVVVLATFASLVGGAAGLARSTGRQLPARISPWDVVLLAGGTHKISRTISKDAVTAPLRAPFTRYAGAGGPAEVQEEVRASSGVRHSLGELFSCPFCLDVWISTAFAIGLVFAPRLTRLVAATGTALTGSDFLQLAYARAQRSAEG
jgi:hypothetical protein